MIIDFNTIEEQELQNFWGGENSFNASIYDDSLNKIIKGRLRPNSSIGIHTHETSSEIIFIISGQCVSTYDGRQEKLSAGDCHYCPKGHSHSLVNNSSEDVIFWAIVPQQ